MRVQARSTRKVKKPRGESRRGVAGAGETSPEDRIEEQGTFRRRGGEFPSPVQAVGTRSP